jgi:hypothetical protein
MDEYGYNKKSDIDGRHWMERSACDKNSKQRPIPA